MEHFLTQSSGSFNASRRALNASLDKWNPDSNLHELLGEQRTKRSLLKVYVKRYRCMHGKKVAMSCMPCMPYILLMSYADGFYRVPREHRRLISYQKASDYRVALVYRRYVNSRKGLKYRDIISSRKALICRWCRFSRKALRCRRPLECRERIKCRKPLECRRLLDSRSRI